MVSMTIMMIMAKKTITMTMGKVVIRHMENMKAIPLNGPAYLSLQKEHTIGHSQRSTAAMLIQQ